MDIIKVENISKAYRGHFWKKNVPALKGLSFEIKRGTVTGFIGPNGAGKTTTIKIILGVVLPNSGKTFINGIESSNPNSRKNLGFVSEQPYFYRHLSVFEALKFSYKLKGFEKINLEKEIKRVLDIVELNGVENKKLFNLSKGMQQRVNMAQALIGNPDLLIFDEPMSGLDPIGRALFRKIFRDLGNEGKTVFFSTHILDDIESICDSIVVLDKGEKKFSGSMDELLKNGTSSIEIIVERLNETLHAKISSLGCQIESHKDGVEIVIPSGNKDVDSAKIQTLLYENSIIPITITKQRDSLESILYGEKGKGLIS